MDSKKKKELELWAAKIRKTALQTIQTAGSGHIGGSFSICDIMSVLYFDKMNVDPANPDKPDRDRLVLSKGHCSPAMYATLALKGFFPVEHLSTFRKLDSDLSGHVEIHVPCMQKQIRLETVYSVSWEMVKSRKARFGKLLCVQASIKLIT